MSGGWWCAAVVIRAIERQNKTNGKMKWNKKQTSIILKPSMEAYLLQLNKKADRQ
jgi:hypothetical protein